jgi:hypothetical protein
VRTPPARHVREKGVAIPICKRVCVATRPTYDACIIPKQEARSTDEEAEEVGSKGTEPRARKLRHGSLY